MRSERRACKAGLSTRLEAELKFRPTTCSPRTTVEHLMGKAAAEVVIVGAEDQGGTIRNTEVEPRA